MLVDALHNFNMQQLLDLPACTDAHRIPIENPLENWKISNLGSDRVCRPMFTLDFKNRVAQKLRRIILLPFELLSFTFL